jgi:hypothetical protein
LSSDWLTISGLEPTAKVEALPEIDEHDVNVVT